LFNTKIEVAKKVKIGLTLKTKSRKEQKMSAPLKITSERE